MTGESRTASRTRLWRSAGIGTILAVLLVAGCGGDETSDTTTTTTKAPATTEAPATTVAETTTTMATTTEAPTTTIAAFRVDSTPIVGVLSPYSAESPVPGPTEAHWYQHDGFYVVLYRGFDASAGVQICAGNSIQVAEGWINISNSPHLGSADEICVGAPKIADSPAGVYACGSLLYYVTEIPSDSEGNLFGTLEIGTVDGFAGSTSSAPSNVSHTHAFVPGLQAYELPPSNVDPGGRVVCG